MKQQKVCASGLIIKNGKILIVKRSDNDDFLPGYYEIPGGKLEFGENPQDGVVREIKEEVGLSTKPLFPLHVGTYLNDTETQTLEIYYLCELADEKQEVILSEEHSEFQWIKMEELHKIHMTDWMKNSIINSYQNVRFL